MVREGNAQTGFALTDFTQGRTILNTPLPREVVLYEQGVNTVNLTLLPMDVLLEERLFHYLCWSIFRFNVLVNCFKLLYVTLMSPVLSLDG